MLTPTWDTLIAFALAGCAVLGFIIRKYKISTLLIALYIALTVANEVGLEVFRFLRKTGMANQDMSLFIVKIVIFVFLGLLLFIEGEYISPSGEGGSGLGQSFMGGAYGLLAGLIIITSCIHFMGAGDQATLMTKSQIARILDPARVWLLVPFPFMLAISSLIKRFR
ncbi:hypothetical protein AUK40_04905 [Candidatus Wirthbacteria bacterium CG2_30_54_11]|uniref:CvpA family protein n=1 Tax=Candidatus Wirthbacteria bacterium CG2_30_54_11 TaxID=1817892 RepID=A0A1J5IHB9_9BACT|nr:MAG: hypothetical protein AUK40_04905 [Candidatus Wirthbacteria bacterium CG2_30_54_11]